MLRRRILLGVAVGAKLGIEELHRYCVSPTLPQLDLGELLRAADR